MASTKKPTGDKLKALNQKPYNKKSRDKWNKEHPDDRVVSRLPHSESEQVQAFVDRMNEEKRFNGNERRAMTKSKAVRLSLRIAGIVKEYDKEDELCQEWMDDNPDKIE